MIHQSSECGYDKLDCCNVDDITKVGNGRCDADKPGYFTEACSWDGGDCFIPQWMPSCDIENEAKLRNGICDEEYNKKECHFDAFGT